MSFFRKKPEPLNPLPRKQGAPSRHVLDLSKIKKEKELQASLDRAKTEKQSERSAAPLASVRSYIPKFFDRSSDEGARHEEPVKKMFERTPELLDRVFEGQDEKRPWGTYFLRGGAFALVVAALLFSVKVFDWKDEAKRTKGEILGEATTAFQDLLQGVNFVQAGDFQNGEEILQKARQEFVGAQSKLEQFNQAILAVARLLPSQGETIATGQHLISGGKSLSDGLTILSQSIPRWFPEKIDATSDKGPNFLSVIESAQKDMEVIAPQLISADNEFSQVSPESIPAEYRQQFESARSAISAVTDKLSRLQSMTSGIRTLLGANGERRYLVLFQNNRELRATGGFIGSYSLVDIKDGKIANIETPKGGPYDIAPNLTEFLKPPTPLQFVNSRWEMHDANWFPDFPTSAKKIQWFYDKSGGPTVDGVIAVTPEVLVRLLKVTGPLEIPEYQTTVSESTVVDLLEKQAEDSSDKQENVPKRIIAVMFPKMLEKIFSLDVQKSAEALIAFGASFDRKDILIAVNDESLEAAFQEFGWTGNIAKTDSDYLMVVGSNIAGGKTDHVVDEWIDQKAAVQLDGTIIDNQTNQEFIRFYVPQGSKLLSSTGFQGPSADKAIQSSVQQLAEDEDLARIEGSPVVDERTGTRTSEEFGKTVFGNWMTVKIGEFEQATIVYELPFKIQKEKKSFLESLFDQSVEMVPYSLTVQKQPGKTSALTASLQVSPAMTVSWNSDNSKLQNEQQVKLSQTIDRDTTYAAVVRVK